MLPGIVDASGVGMSLQFLDVARENAVAMTEKLEQRFGHFMAAPRARGDRAFSGGSSSVLRLHVEGWRALRADHTGLLGASFPSRCLPSLPYKGASFPSRCLPSCASLSSTLIRDPSAQPQQRRGAGYRTVP